MDETAGWLGGGCERDETEKQVARPERGRQQNGKARQGGRREQEGGEEDERAGGGENTNTQGTGREGKVTEQAESKSSKRKRA